MLHPLTRLPFAPLLFLSFPSLYFADLWIGLVSVYRPTGDGELESSSDLPAPAPFFFLLRCSTACHHVHTTICCGAKSNTPFAAAHARTRNETNKLKNNNKHIYFTFRSMDRLLHGVRLLQHATPRQDGRADDSRSRSIGRS
uniref:Putative secreted protein n=1 Tax=Anopheles darlingi TaxID=43151 RepID=A0A2M4DJ92_ANODA